MESSHSSRSTGDGRGTPSRASRLAKDAGAPLLVLGAGPCGLAAAHEARARGHEVLVLEAQDAPGGLCRTIRAGAFAFDLGGHRFVSPNEELIRWIRSLLGDELRVGCRRSAIRLDATRRIRYPIELGDLLRNVPLGEGARYLGGFLAARARRAMRRGESSSDSLAAWVRERFGAPIAARFFEGYSEKVWGLPATELAADWAPQRLSMEGLGEALRGALAPRRHTPRSFARRYLYPRRGFGAIPEAIAAAVRRRGGRIRTGVRRWRLRVEGRRIRAVVVSGGEGSETEIPVGGVVSTVPLRDLLDALPAADDARKAARGLRTRALRFVFLMIGRERVGEETWSYVPGREHLLSRIQEPTRRSPDLAPRGTTSLLLEIPCREGDEVSRLAEETLVARSLEDLDRLGVPVREDLLGWRTARARDAYPVHDRAYAPRRRRALDAAHRFENLVVAGRQGAFRYVFSDTAMEMGMLAVRALEGEVSREVPAAHRSARRLLEVESVA